MEAEAVTAGSGPKHEVRHPIRPPEIFHGMQFGYGLKTIMFDG